MARMPHRRFTTQPFAVFIGMCLALEGAARIAEDRRPALFLPDGIHLTRAGNKAIAAAIDLHLFGEQCPASH